MENLASELKKDILTRQLPFEITPNHTLIGLQLFDNDKGEVQMNDGRLDLDLLHEQYYASPMALKAYRQLNQTTTTNDTTTPTTTPTTTATTTASTTEGTINNPGSTGDMVTEKTPKHCVNDQGEMIKDCET